MPYMKLNINEKYVLTSLMKYKIWTANLLSKNMNLISV